MLTAFASPVGAAQNACNTRDELLSQFLHKYQEAPVAVGIDNRGGLIEVLSTRDGKTWTILVTNVQGMSCLVAAGEGWRVMKYVPLEPET